MASDLDAPIATSDTGLAQGEATQARRRISQKVAIAVVYIAGMFLAGIDSTIVNVALPSIGRNFHLGPASLDAVSVAYLLSLAVSIPVSGWLCDHHGGKRVLLCAMALFTLASVLCAVSPDLLMLVLARMLQGLAGGLMTPVGLTMLFRAVPPHERVRVAALVTAPVAVAPAIGPILGGFFVSELSWRWAFLINLPLGVLAVVFGLLMLEDDGLRAGGRFDVVGFVLATVGASGLTYGVSEGSVRGWASPLILASLIGGVVSLAALIVVELRTASPLLDLMVFADRLFRCSSGVLVLGSAMFVAWLYLVAQFYQNALGYSPLQAGLSTLPQTLGVMCGLQLGSRVFYPRFGPRRTMAVGFANTALWTASLIFLDGGEHVWAWAALFLTGAGLPSVFQSAQAAGFATISHARTGGASTLYSSQRQLAGAIGVAAVTTVLVRVAGHHAGETIATVRPYHVAFLVLAGVCVLGIPIALRMDDRAAAATMRRSGDAVPTLAE